VCTKEMCALRDSLSKLNTIGAQVVAVSVDAPAANKGFSEVNKLSFPVLSDYSREAVKQFGVLLNNFGGLKGLDVAKRSVFVLDKAGIVRYAWVSEDPGVEPPYDEVIKAVGSIN